MPGHAGSTGKEAPGGSGGRGSEGDMRQKPLLWLPQQGTGEGGCVSSGPAPPSRFSALGTQLVLMSGTELWGDEGRQTVVWKVRV